MIITAIKQETDIQYAYKTQIAKILPHEYMTPEIPWTTVRRSLKPEIREHKIKGTGKSILRPLVV